jgi:putative transposase
LVLEEKIREEYGTNIGHNRIQKVLKERGLAKNEPNKQKRRKWVRYERKHSMSLWHTDWYWLEKEKKWIIAYEDDASRMIMAHGKFDSISTESAIEVYERASGRYGDPREVLTDRDSTFYASGGDGKEKGVCKFEEYLSSKGVKHIVGRVSHPQTNGKIERWFGTVEMKYAQFNGDIEKLVEWYNDVKPHLSLRFNGHYETPAESFWRKLLPEKIMGFMTSWFWEA